MGKGRSRETEAWRIAAGSSASLTCPLLEKGTRGRGISCFGTSEFARHKDEKEMWKQKTLPKWRGV